MTVIIALVMLGIIVFVHELGHFLTAKYFKMNVLEFSIGMGTKLISKKIGETIYSIRLLPLGGFVNIAGMEANDESSKIEKGFYTKSPFSQFLVLVAGVVMNFLTAWIAIVFLVLFTNFQSSYSVKPIISKVSEVSNAKNQLKENDKILEINNKKIKNLNDLHKELIEINKNNKIKNEKVKIKILRENKKITEEIKMTYNLETKLYLLGIDIKSEKLTTLEKIKDSFVILNSYTLNVFEGLKMLFTGKVKIREMTGVVALPKVIGSVYVNNDFTILVKLFILLSINIGVMNLLPIPALDGGRILFTIPEFFGIKLNKKILEKINLVGMILLLFLMVFTVINDIFKYF